ncbi:hypothetical protein, variant [Fonticula alba]|nr:hypothetical protein, variant [Fonticula alba]KCV69676.1 hypothetical protein, variant [Fonticula alba]|eukprot:XP_009496241.1 hypothetical protein, variant [Fonticula alba]
MQASPSPPGSASGHQPPGVASTRLSSLTQPGILFPQYPGLCPDGGPAAGAPPPGASAVCPGPTDPAAGPPASGPHPPGPGRPKSAPGGRSSSHPPAGGSPGMSVASPPAPPPLPPSGGRSLSSPGPGAGSTSSPFSTLSRGFNLGARRSKKNKSTALAIGQPGHGKPNKGGISPPPAAVGPGGLARLGLSPDVPVDPVQGWFMPLNAELVVLLHGSVIQLAKCLGALHAPSLLLSGHRHILIGFDLSIGILVLLVSSSAHSLQCPDVTDEDMFTLGASVSGYLDSIRILLEGLTRVH